MKIAIAAIFTDSTDVHTSIYVMSWRTKAKYRVVISTNMNLVTEDILTKNRNHILYKTK